MPDNEGANPHHRHDIADKLRAMGVMPGHVDPEEVESGRRSFRFVEIMLMVLVAVALIWFIYYLNNENSDMQTSVVESSNTETSKKGEIGSEGEASAAIDDAQSAITDKKAASKGQVGKESTNSQNVKSSETAKQAATSSSSQGVTAKAPAAVASQPYGRPGAMQPPWGQRPGYYPQFNQRRVESTTKAGEVASDKPVTTGEAGQKQVSTNAAKSQQGYVYPYAAPPYRGYYPYPPPGYRPYAPWQQR